MATLASLVVKLGLDAADFKSGIEGARASAERFAEDAGRLGAKMSLGITTPLVGAGTAVLKMGSDFESAFAGVRKTVDATEPELAQMRQGIRDMAKEIPASANEIAGVAEAAGQLGIAKGNILGFTRVMTDLGVATNMTAQDAATQLARLANITQMPQTEFDRLGSTVVHLGNNLATTESEIVAFGLRIAGAGKTVGLSEAQILAWGGALSSLGIEAEAGGTAISRTFITIAGAINKGGKDLEMFARVAGMSAEEYARLFKEDASNATLAFVEGLGRIRDAGGDVFSVLEALGLSEIRVRDALLRTSGAGDLVRNSLNMATQAWQENIALTNEAAQRYDTVESRFTVLRNKAMDLGISLYDYVRPSVIGVIDSVSGLIDRGADLVSKLDTINPQVLQFAAGFTAVLAASGPAALALAGIAAALAFVLSPVGAIIIAVGILAGLWASDWNGMRDVIEGAVGTMLGRLNDLVNFLDKNLGTALQILVPLIVAFAVATGVRAVAATAAWAKELVVAAAATLRLAVATGVNAVVSMVQFVAGIPKSVAALKELISFLIFAGRYYVVLGAQAVASAAAQATAWLATALPAVVAAAGGIIAAIGSVLVPVLAIAAVIGLVAVAWANNWGDIQGITGRILDWISDRIAEFVNWLGSLPIIREVTGWIGGAVSAAKEAIPALVQPASDAVGGIISEFQNGFPTLQKAVRDMFSMDLGELGLTIDPLGDWQAPDVTPEEDIIAMAGAADTAADSMTKLDASIPDLSGLTDGVGEAADETGNLADQAAQALGGIKPLIDYLVRTHPASIAAADAVNTLKLRLTGLEDQLKANQEAIRTAQEDLRGMQEKVSQLSEKLSEARRRLDDLARPRLRGQGELEDQLFQIDQHIKRLKLMEMGVDVSGLMPIDPAARAFVATLPDSVDELQKLREQMELTKSLKFDEQLRLIEKAAKGTAQEMTFEEALRQITATKSEIAGLEGQLNAAQAAVKAQEQYIRDLESASRALNLQIEQTREQLRQAEERQTLVNQALEKAITWYIQDREKLVELGGEAVNQATLVDEHTRALVESTRIFAEQEAASAISAIRAALDEYERAKATLAAGLSVPSAPAPAAVVPDVPGFASGVRGFGGGLAVVGEEGPELVNLPPGSDVIPNARVSGLAAMPASDPIDYERLADELSKRPILMDGRAVADVVTSHQRRTVGRGGVGLS